MLPIFFIFVSELVKAFLVQHIPVLFKASSAPLFLLILYTTQFFGSPIQGGFSDKYCRRRSLLFSLALIIASLAIIYFAEGFWLKLSSVLIFGALGNADVLARAGLMDTTEKSKRPNMLRLSFLILPFPWILVAAADQVFGFHSGQTLTILLFAIVALVLAYFKFWDSRDKDRTEPVMPITAVLNTKGITFGLLAFLAAEVAFQAVYLNEDNRLPRSQLAIETLIFAAGFILGIIIAMRSRSTNKMLVLSGVIISALSLSISLIMEISNINLFILQAIIGFGIFTCGSGIYLPSLFSFYSNRQPMHAQGKVFGILESTMTLGEMITVLIFWCFNLTTMQIHISSILLFFLSWIVFLNVLQEKKN